MTTKEDSAGKALFGAVTLILVVLVGASPSFAQTSAQRNDALMNEIHQAHLKLGAQRRYLSGGLRNALNLAERWNTIKTGISRAAAAQGVRALASVGVTASGVASRETGFTQSETSTAWCGTNAVIGFNDSGSILETEAAALGGTSGLSFMGYAQSINATTTTPTFADKGPVPAGPVTSGMGFFVASDPVVGCSSASNFYLSAVGFDCSSFVPNGSITACAAAQSNVTVSPSTDGGATFDAPNVAIAKNFPDHMLDKDWMAVDAAHGEIYVTYTDFDNSSGNICGTDIIQIERVAIELVSSIDGGMTWSAPTEVTHVCADQLVNPNTSVSGSQIAVAKDGSVYVAWEAMGLGGADPSVREIDIAKSAIGGALFGAANKITNVNCVGDCADGILQGSIRIAELPSLVTGKGTQSSKLFMTWNDGDNPQTDALIGTYNFADVKLVSSSDGVTWSAPVKVNINPVSNTDRFQPAVSVDKSGRVAVCFYDRRNDPNNFLIDRYCASSTNGGASFTNVRITSRSFPSVVSQDVLIAPSYMGDYDTLASDTLNSLAGFRGGFANNISGAPNVQSFRY
jgi:hypothetical protein